MDDATFLPRLLVGGAALGALAWIDHRRNGPRARRWRELSFLFATACGAVIFALVHDAITATLCPEYFVVGKGVAAERFHAGVVWLAARAGWTAGLFVGLVLIVANNPARDARPQLSHRRLRGFLVFPFLGAITLAPALGVLANRLAPVVVRATDLDLLELPDERAFVTVWAIHLGTYVGAAFGCLAAPIAVRAERLRDVAAVRECGPSAMDPMRNQDRGGDTPTGGDTRSA